jgi:hypothetical protein
MAPHETGSPSVCPRPLTRCFLRDGNRRRSDTW